MLFLDCKDYKSYGIISWKSALDTSTRKHRNWNQVNVNSLNLNVILFNRIKFNLIIFSEHFAAV